MEQLNQDRPLNTPTQKDSRVPQLPLRSGLKAGASVESCMQDLAYWQNQYYNKCGYAYPVPY